MSFSEGKEFRIKLFKILGIVIGSAALFYAVCMIFFMIQINKAMKWDVIKEPDRAHFEELIMMPGMADKIENVCIRGIRDPSYCVRTKAYDSLEKLYDELPFSNEFQKKEALGAVKETAEELPKIPGDEEIIKAFIPEILPLRTSDKDGPVIASYYEHQRFIIQTENGFRGVFIVMTN